jgi:sortase A
MKLEAGMRFAYYALIAIAIGALGYCAAAWWRGRQFQNSEAHIFDQELKPSYRAAIQHPIPKEASAPEAGGLLGRLEIPRIGISVMVVEGDGAADLEHAVGHIPGTPLPGERGNVALAGHRDTFFRPLAEIHCGDTLSIATLRGTYRYQVVFTKIVRPADLSLLYPTGRDTLTLVTCYPFHYLGAAPMRFIVRAVQLP